MRPRSDSPRVPPRLKLTVRPSAEGLVRGGHPWIYEESVRRQNREGESGELVVVYDRNDRFLDQRENRRRRREALAGGTDVLNAFSFSGGFSLYAARGGAKSATDLDLSRHALDSAKRNFVLNRDDPLGKSRTGGATPPIPTRSPTAGRARANQRPRGTAPQTPVSNLRAQAMSSRGSSTQ